MFKASHESKKKNTFKCNSSMIVVKKGGRGVDVVVGAPLLRDSSVVQSWDKWEGGVEIKQWGGGKAVGEVKCTADCGRKIKA